MHVDVFAHAHASHTRARNARRRIRTHAHASQAQLFAHARTLHTPKYSPTRTHFTRSHSCRLRRANSYTGFTPTGTPSLTCAHAEKKRRIRGGCAGRRRYIRRRPYLFKIYGSIKGEKRNAASSLLYLHIIISTSAHSVG